MKTLIKQTRLSRQQTSFVALLLLMVFVFIGGCSQGRYPKDWQPAVIASAGQCPDITGTYKIEHDSAFTPTGYSGSIVSSGTYQIVYPVAYHALAGQYFHKEEGTQSIWEVMTISGDPQESLQVVLYRRGSDAWINKAITLKKGSEGFLCTQGWLQSVWPRGTPMRDADDADWRGLDKTLNFAKNLAGELVIRTDVARWQEVSVWCGDGCKYVRIPFTRETTYEWARWSSAQISTFEPIPAPLPVSRNLDANAPADESPAGRVTRILRTLTPSGVRIVSVRADGERWVARVHGGTDNLIALHEKLLTSEVFSDVTAKAAEPREADGSDKEFSFVIAINEKDTELLLETRELARRLELK